MFYIQDTATGRQTSLRTKDETEAKSLLNARNEAQRQPVLNLHLARAYLTASDPAFVERTWQPGQTRLPFALYVRNDNHRPRLVKLIASCGPLDMDAPEPAITVMMPDED